MESFHRAGAIPAVMKELIKNKKLHTNIKTVTGKTVKENLRVFENELGDTRLEFEYLSSTEKLLEYQTKYFEKDLIQKNIDSIKTLNKKSNDLFISDLNIFEINEKK